MTLQKDYLNAALAEGVPRDELITDERELEYFGTDVYRTGDAPIVAVRPASSAGLAAAVRAAATIGLAVIPRGGGASYSDGYVTSGFPYLSVDTANLNLVEIDEQNSTVTVGAGVTWAELKSRLDARAWRTPFWGPFSGIAATVGGSVSQHAVSHGSGAHGISAPSILGMEVVLANGEILKTGAAAAGGPGGVRHFGPDLTGLFTGDCGAFGLKATITLPLLRTKPAFRTASFSFQSFSSLHNAMHASALEMLDDEHFALDAALSQGQLGKEKNAARTAEVVKTVLQSHGLVKGLGQLIKMAFGGTRSLETAEYACHYIIEGSNEAEARAKLSRLRSIMKPYGTEMVNSVPTVVRGMPFAPLLNTLGPKGERWVPLHGIMSHAEVEKFHVAFNAFMTERRSQLDQFEIWYGAMFSSVGSSGFLYEIALYWPDHRTIYHEKNIDPEYLSVLPVYKENPEARAYVDQLKMDLIELYVAHSASFFQIGRAYPYRSRLNEPAAKLLDTIKTSLDQSSQINPEVLGLGDKHR